MSTLKVNTLLAADGNPLTPVAIPGLDKRFATAWVNFNGIGTVVSRAANNVASITDNAVGTYTINFSVPMDNTNYCAVCSVGPAGSSSVIYSPQIGSTGLGVDSAPTVNGFTIFLYLANQAADFSRVMAVVFGGRA